MLTQTEIDRKMCPEMFLISFLALVILVNDVHGGNGDCYCGFGGPCRFVPFTTTPCRTDCSKCADVSKGLYRDCHELLDRCLSAPCLNGGTCESTFGGFFCRCDPPYYGHTCQNMRKKREKLAVVSAPRIWYQVNRVYGGVTRETQLIHFSVEEPGDAMRLQVRFSDGRFILITDADLKLTNQKAKCLESVRKWPKPSDPAVCETLPDRDLQSASIELTFFDDKFATKPYTSVEVEIDGQNITSGRLDDIHVTILNWKRITYSESYRVYSIFDIWPKCLYKINFYGCSVSSETPIIYEGDRPIHLESIRIPLSRCEGISRVKDISWYMAHQANSPFLSSPNAEDVYLNGRDLASGNHYINFVMTAEGRPPYHGHPALSYNYGRCWIKIVKGDLNVGIEGGNSRAVPCINPISFRIFSYNANYKEADFASIWRCNIAALELCERQRFLGPKIFFRPPPCGKKIKFTAMVVDASSGSKTFLTATVGTSVHIDSIHCRCTYNCYPSINPLSSVAMSVEQILYSTNANRKYGNIKWEAQFAGEEWGIERFIVPEMQSTRIQIPPYTFSYLTEKQYWNPHLRIKASKNDLYCTIVVEVSVPLPTPIVGVSAFPHYVETVDDERFRITVVEHTEENLHLPISCVLSETLSPNSSEREVVAYILADDQHFSTPKLQEPTYVTCTNHLGLASQEKMLLPVGGKPKEDSTVAIKNTIQVIRFLALTGNDNDALTEMVYVSRSIARSNLQQYYSFKMKIMQIMNDVTIGMDSSASNSVVSSQLNKILNTINRLTLISNLTESPFNISIDPWTAPVMPRKDKSTRDWVATFTMASITIHSVTNYYYQHVLKRITTPNDVHILQLMFQAILRIQMVWSWKDYALKLMAHNPVLLFEMLIQARYMISSMHKAIELLMKSMDFHIDGYTGHLRITAGTSTASGSVFLKYDSGDISARVFNELNDVQITVNVNDSTVGDTDSLYLGVFVEIPLNNDITTRIHVFLVTHLTQRSVEGNVDIRMNISNYKRICDPEQCLTVTTSRSSNERSLAVFKLELGSHQDVLGIDADRKVKINLKSNSSLQSVLRNGVPTYDEVDQAPSKNYTELVEVVEYNDAFLGVLPANNIFPDVPISYVIDTMQFVCVQKVYDDPTFINSTVSRSICEIVHTVQSDREAITCRCPRSGLIQTVDVRLKLTKVLPGSRERQRSEHGKFEIQNRVYHYLIMVYPVLALLLILFAYWRERAVRKRALIQMLADTFPGDEFAYIVCVRTDHRAMAGTRANVGIQIFGSISASRVHILRSKSYKALRQGHDDWFAIFTPERLGRLNYITLWQDYTKRCPAWYCSEVLVYDVEHQVWFRFTVERWLHISAQIEKSRITIVRSRNYVPEKEVAENFSFRQHFCREMKNTHSLLSPFTKHRRFVHSFVMRACLTSMLVLTMVSLVIILDALAKEKKITVSADNVILIAIVAALVASIPFTLASFLFTRSLVKMKRTKTLDLNWVEHVKTQFSEELTESDRWSKRQTVTYSVHQIPIVAEILERQKMSISSKKRKMSTSRSHTRSKKSSQFSNQSYSTSMHKWVASSIYRPISVQKYEYRINWFYFVIAWILVASTIAVNTAFIFIWMSVVGWFIGRNGFMIVTVAIVIEFIRSTLAILFLSCHTIYSQKRCNSEIFCLDLNGLQNQAIIRDHLKFIQDRTKPYYHPLDAAVIKVMYEKKKKKDTFLRAFSLLVICVGMVLLVHLSPWFKDTPNIYRVLKSTEEAYLEPLRNSFTHTMNLLKDVHTREDLSNYVLATLLPVSSVNRWYNNKPLYIDPSTNKASNFMWFVDRSSWLHGASTVRFLQAHSAPPHVSNYFRKLNFTTVFEDAHGHFDKHAKYKTTYNRWHVLVKNTESQARLDDILKRGIFGVTNMFYPSSIGEEITPSRDTKQHPDEITLIISKFISKRTRAVIAEINIAHPTVSDRVDSPQVGFTIIHILLENCASGMYTGSIRSDFFRANYSQNYLRLASLYALFTILCAIPLAIALSFDGFRAGSKRLLNLVLFFGTTSSLVATISNICVHFYYELNDLANVHVDNHHLEYYRFLWLVQCAEAASGFFLLLTTVAGAIWWAELTGMSNGKIVYNFFHLFTAYIFYLFVSFCIGILSSEGTFESSMKFNRISVYTHVSTFSDHIHFLYIIVNRTLLCPLQIGVVMAIMSSYLSSIEAQDSETKIKLADFRGYPKNKIWIHKTGKQNTPDLTPAMDSSPSLLGSTSLMGPEDSPSARLERKFSLWK